jgi:hypothetical protein
MATEFENLSDMISREFGIDIVPKGIDDSSVELRASELLPVVARKMGRRVDDFRKCLKKISLDDTLLISGRATSEDEWQTFEVGLSTGLLLFHHQMVILFVSLVTVVGDANEIVDETKISNDEMLSTAKRLMQAFWDGDKPSERFFLTPGFSLLSLTKSQIELAAGLLHYADMFVVAHEFGHILINTAPECVKREMLIVEGARESMVRPVLNEHEGHDDTAILHWMDEITADFIGVSLCKELGNDKVLRMVIHSSAVMSLVMCDMLEKYHRKLTGISWEYRTHPPSHLRLEVLQTLSDWPAGLDLGTSFRQLSDHIMANI